MATTRDTDWTTSRTWSTGELVTATMMNEHVRDQLNALKSPAIFHHIVNEGANYSTSSTSYADIDATDLSATVTTAGGNIDITFVGYIDQDTGAARTYFDILVDGNRWYGDDGGGVYVLLDGPFCFRAFVTGLSAGSHTFKMQWKVSAGTSTMYAGAGTANLDIHPLFLGIECA